MKDHDTIRLTGYIQECKARKAWQLMFNLYLNGEGNLKNMDNMLCDFINLEKAYSERLKVSVDKIIFHWAFDKEGDCTSWEEREDSFSYIDTAYDFVYIFTLTDDEVSYITIKDGE